MKTDARKRPLSKNSKPPRDGRNAMTTARRWNRVLSAVSILTLAAGAEAADWPTWRYDAGRTASSPQRLAPALHLQWSRELGTPRPAWPASQRKIQFDASYEPIAVGRTVFVPSMVRDRVTAYDTRTGREKWRFYADGPVRFAPAACEGRLYFVSDDGYLYCLDAAGGKLLWKFRGGPADRRVLGNERLISAWCARGAPVIRDGRVYFAASIWPFMGVFVHALDARDGKVLWTNSGTGSDYVDQQHDSPAFAGVAPQGYLTATENVLLVSGGRTVPAGFDRRTGRLLYFEVSSRQFGKDAGGYGVLAGGQWFFNGKAMYRLADGAGVLWSEADVLTDKALIRLEAPDALSAHAIAPATRTAVDRRGKKTTRLEQPQLWRVKLAVPIDRLFCRVGGRLIAGREGEVLAFDVPAPGAKPGKGVQPTWRGQVQGDPWTALAADDRLLVVTREGKLYCFGPEAPAGGVKKHPLPSPPFAKPLPALPPRGICMVWGMGRWTPKRLRLQAADFHVIVIDPDPKKVAAMRRGLDADGLYGSRVHVLAGDPPAMGLPPYLASLITSDDLPAAGLAKGEAFVRKVFGALRPYGGEATFDLSDAQHAAMAKALSDARLPGARLTRRAEAGGGKTTTLSRIGPLPGSAAWTHQYADPGNTVMSKDQLVKPPLGLLWFGGPSNDKILPRHEHGPSPQVVGGRLFIEGKDLLRAVDVYTGRLLWERALPDLGKFYDVPEGNPHRPGANAIGGNYVSVADGIYVVTPTRCLRLDPATGKTTAEIELPAAAGGARPRWGAIAVWKDLLIAMASPIDVPTGGGGAAELPKNMHPIVPKAAQWRYLAGKHPGRGWAQLDYDETGWKSGQAGFGYADKDDKTVLADMQGRYGVVYLRKRFHLPSVADVGKLTLMINYDDAFIAYLNGVEVLRVGVGRGSGDTAVGIAGHEAAGHEPFDVPNASARLRKGDNVLAIEGHNAGVDNSDFTLDPYLGLLRRDAPPLRLGEIPGVKAAADYASAGRQVVVLNRHSGQVLWSRPARQNFRHNAVAVGDGKVFCIDKMSDLKLAYLRRRGYEPKDRPVLYALDARSGRVVWKKEKNVFGTWLGYSAEHDVLLEAGSGARDRAPDEARRGMAAYRGRDGELLWKSDVPYDGPCLLHHDTIITQGGALGLRTGEPKMRPHPLSGRKVPWTFTRNYGCNTAIAGEHLLTFRSAAAGYYDLTGDGGTGNFGGFKSGCTSNLIAADGVLNAPDYTRTCTCSYQNQTSLALVHDPTVATWTFNELPAPGGPVKRVGINFGAPGDRLAEGGTLWLEMPVVGGPSPPVSVALPSSMVAFREHPSARKGRWRWVTASGVRGGGTISVGLTPTSSVVARPCPKRPFLDGKLDDPCWKDARPVPLTGPPDAARNVTLLLRQDAEALYVGYRRRADRVGGKPVPFVARKTGLDAFCWEDDDLELFLTDKARKIGLQLAVAAGGGRFDGLAPIDTDRYADIQWNGEWRHAVTRTPDAWSAELALPRAMLRKAGLDPGTLAINVQSQHRSGRRAELLLAPVGQGGFGRCRNFLVVRTGPKRIPPRSFRVRLFFAEPDGLAAGKRVFDVAVGGNVLKSFDIAGAAAEPGGAVIRVFPNVSLGRELKITLTPKVGSPVLCGVEIVQE